VTTAHAEDLPMLRFVQALLRCPSLDQLGQAFATGFGRLMAVPMYGFNVVEPGTTRLRHNTSIGVSDVFVARYIREVMDDDPLRVQAHDSARAVYNLDLMSAPEWEESDAYRRAFSMHRMHHVVEAPLMAAGLPIGSLHYATAAAEHDVGPADVRRAQAVADVLAQAVEDIGSRERLERDRDAARAAVDIAGTAVVLSDPGDTELRPNDAARRLLADIVDAEEPLHRLLGRPAGDGPFSRRVEVELVTGEYATLLADTSPLAADGGVLVTVLELRREHPRIAAPALAALTTREAEVAGLVVDGLADREIAEQLLLSHHTVTQYVKRIYRKLDVDSRVGLTRLLLGAPPPGRPG
jgi:DNA-binding CsgD family transcriptional regulator